MAETLTTNYAWTKPDPGASANTWGSTLNATTDKIDAQVFINQQAGVPVGAMAMWPGATAPANWLICNGASLATTGTYAALFAILGYTYGGSGGNFNLPNLVQKFPLGAGVGAGTNPVGATGGNFSNTIATGNLPAHAHPITDVGHTHTVNQWYHDHGYSQTPHGHLITEPAGGAGHAHGGVVTGLGPPTGIIAGTVGGAQLQTGATAYATTGITIQLNSASISFSGVTSSVSLVASGTNLSTTQNAGGGTPLSVVPPFVALNYIIKFA